jgi:DNA polymerase III epsilon subunit family exonuclease
MIALSTPVRLVTFISVDVETTGLDPSRDDIVELAAVKVRDGQMVDQFATLVHIDSVIPLGARRVHGIDNTMLVGQPRIGEALQRMFEFAGDGVLVEHSYKSFDVGFIERAYGQKVAAPYLNTCTLSRKLFPHMRSHSLQECCKRHHIANARAHRALDDARATADLLVCLLELSSPRYPRLQDLMKVASVER